MPPEIKFNDKEKITIAELYFHDNETQLDIGKKYGISDTKVNQICTEYMEKYKQVKRGKIEPTEVKYKFVEVTPIQIYTIGDVGPAFDWNYLNTIPH